MAFSPSFTTGQFIGAPNTIVLTDNSTGSDGTIASRIIYLQKYDGTFLTGNLAVAGQNYIAWLYANPTISLPILDKDYAFFVTVKWLAANGTVLYTASNFSVNNMYAKMLDDTLISAQQAYPAKVNDTSYYLNRMKLRVAINDAINSIVDMSDITNSQQACDRGNYFVNNPSLFY